MSQRFALACLLARHRLKDAPKSLKSAGTPRKSSRPISARPFHAQRLGADLARGRMIFRRGRPMSQSECERFAADLKSNEALRTEAEKAGAQRSLASIVAFASSKGYSFTVDQVRE